MQAAPDTGPSGSQPAAAGPPTAAAAPLDLLVKACLHPAEHQLAVLRRILAAHSGVQLLAPVSSQAARAAELSGAELAALLRTLPQTSYVQHYEPSMQAALAAADADDTAGALAELSRVCGEAPTAGSASGQFWQTSGTTGKAKVVPVTPSLLAEEAKVRAAWCRLRREAGTSLYCHCCLSATMVHAATSQALFDQPATHPCTALALCPCDAADGAAARPAGWAFEDLEIKLAFVGPARALGNGWTVGRWLVGGRHDGGWVRSWVGASLSKGRVAGTGITECTQAAPVHSPLGLPTISNQPPSRVSASR